MAKEIASCPICGEEKSLEVWHRPLPYKELMITRACSECYIQHIWPFKDISE
ncbi:MAG: hypothetical protein HOE69_08495 [Euryarchaeota archaeon]|jgi:RNA polymerase subunit RPABC4/transcription elongation factor Spt4|nr:hypothetical protein [Euryarchaeota archaeon]